MAKVILASPLMTLWSSSGLTFNLLAALSQCHTQRFYTISKNRTTRVGRILHWHFSASLMVVNQIHISDIGSIETEYNPPISRYSYGPETGQITAEGVESKTGFVHILGSGSHV